MNVFRALSSPRVRAMLIAALEKRSGRRLMRDDPFAMGGLSPDMRNALAAGAAGVGAPAAFGAGAGAAGAAMGEPLSGWRSYDEHDNEIAPDLGNEMEYGAEMALLSPIVGAGALATHGPLAAYEAIAELSADRGYAAYDEPYTGPGRPRDGRFPRAPSPRSLLTPRRPDRESERSVLNIFKR